MSAAGAPVKLPAPAAAILAVALALAVLSACTPTELDAWLVWYHRDPVAAVAYAEQPHIQADLHAVDVEASGEQLEEAPQVDSVWDRLAECESGQTWDYNGGSGFDGGLQFLPATWRAYGGREYTEYAWQASREAQIDIAERVLDDVGWGAWPACSRKLGLR